MAIPFLYWGTSHPVNRLISEIKLSLRRIKQIEQDHFDHNYYSGCSRINSFGLCFPDNLTKPERDFLGFGFLWEQGQPDPGRARHPNEFDLRCGWTGQRKPRLQRILGQL